MPQVVQKQVPHSGRQRLTHFFSLAALSTGLWGQDVSPLLPLDPARTNPPPPVAGGRGLKPPAPTGLRQVPIARAPDMEAQLSGVTAELRSMRSQLSNVTDQLSAVVRDGQASRQEVAALRRELQKTANGSWLSRWEEVGTLGRLALLGLLGAAGWAVNHWQKYRRIELNTAYFRRLEYRGDTPELIKDVVNTSEVWRDRSDQRAVKRRIALASKNDAVPNVCLGSGGADRWDAIRWLHREKYSPPGFMQLTPSATMVEPCLITAAFDRYRQGRKAMFFDWCKIKDIPRLFDTVLDHYLKVREDPDKARDIVSLLQSVVIACWRYPASDPHKPNFLIQWSVQRAYRGRGLSERRRRKVAALTEVVQRLVPIVGMSHEQTCAFLDRAVHDRAARRGHLKQMAHKEQSLRNSQAHFARHFALSEIAANPPEASGQSDLREELGRIRRVLDTTVNALAGDFNRFDRTCALTRPIESSFAAQEKAWLEATNWLLALQNALQTSCRPGRPVPALAEQATQLLTLAGQLLGVASRLPEARQHELLQIGADFDMESGTLRSFDFPPASAEALQASERALQRLERIPPTAVEERASTLIAAIDTRIGGRKSAEPSPGRLEVGSGVKRLPWCLIVPLPQQRTEASRALTPPEAES